MRWSRHIYYSFRIVLFLDRKWTTKKGCKCEQVLSWFCKFTQRSVLGNIVYKLYRIDVLKQFYYYRRSDMNCRNISRHIYSQIITILIFLCIFNDNINGAGIHYYRPMELDTLNTGFYGLHWTYYTFTLCKSGVLIMEPWKNLTVVKCRLKRPSSSRSGGFLETKGLIKSDKKVLKDLNKVNKTGQFDK